MGKRKDRTVGQQFDERLATMETKLKNLASVIEEGHVPLDGEQTQRVADLMTSLSADLTRLAART